MGFPKYILSQNRFLNNHKKVILPCRVVDDTLKITFAEQKGIKNVRGPRGKLLPRA